MTDKDQLHYLLGYLEGLKTKDTILPTDLSVVVGAVESNSLFHEPHNRVETYENNFHDNTDYDDHKESYGQYAGSYAQDVEGLSDDFINDVLEGDPDNYWNID